MSTSARSLASYEAWLVALGVATVLLFTAFVAFILVLPINNYFQADGTVQYKGERTLVSEVEGVVTEVCLADHAKIRRRQPILKVMNEERQGGAKALGVRIALLENQLAQLQKLEASGALDLNPVESKRLELQQAEQELALMRKANVEANTEGYFYFLNPPRSLLGTYIRKGDVVGYLYESSEKEVDVVLPALWVDRFDSRMRVRIQYRNPVSYLSRNVAASIDAVHANKLENTIRIVCRFHESPEAADEFRPGTIVQASFLVSSSSIFQEIFGIDPYTSAAARIAAWAARP